jgi:hypothetical protein
MRSVPGETTDARVSTTIDEADALGTGTSTSSVAPVRSD